MTISFSFDAITFWRKKNSPSGKKRKTTFCPDRRTPFSGFFWGKLHKNFKPFRSEFFGELGFFGYGFLTVFRKEEDKTGRWCPRSLTAAASSFKLFTFHEYQIIRPTLRGLKRASSGKFLRDEANSLSSERDFFISVTHLKWFSPFHSSWFLKLVFPSVC